MTSPNGPRIAIRFGSSSKLKGPQGSPRPAPSTTLGKRPRPRFTHDDDDDHSSGEEADHAQPESITHFGANGAEYVDENHAHTDRHRAQDMKAAQPKPESPAGSGYANGQAAEKLEEETLQWGLTITKKPKPAQSKDDQVEKNDGPQKTKTADEEALDALLGKDNRSINPLHRTEDDAYRDAAAAAPEVDDLHTYDTIPVEGFGASLLMGQGWDGKMRGPKAKEITKRAHGMGLGAKKLKAEEDLGGWDNKGKGGKNDRRPRLDEYRQQKDKDRYRREDRHRDSYKTERERERDRDRRGNQDRNHGKERDRDRVRDSQRNGDSNRDYGR